MIDNKIKVASLIKLRDLHEMEIDTDEYDLLGNIADQLMENAEIEPICKIVFGIPYYFCGNCKTMLNMYSTKANYCSKCGRAVKWSYGEQPSPI